VTRRAYNNLAANVSNAAGAATDPGARLTLLRAASDLAMGIAPYVHPTLAAIQHSGPGGGPQHEHGLSPKAQEMVEAIKRGLDEAGAGGGA
jgi:hypothetical protein